MSKKEVVPELSIEEIYKKKTLHQHILALPDTYIGPCHVDTLNLYVYDEEEEKIVKKNKEIVLGLYKIFDEILVNAADNTVRDAKCNKIEVTINEKTGEIQVSNNGSTIPVELHKEENMYVPEMIMGTLLTSGNYDRKDKTVGARNGLGSKCCKIDTLIPLYSGEVKMAKDVLLTDRLIGDDGRRRKIKKIIRGEGKMYKVSQTNGLDYMVNSDHILTLHVPDHKVIVWNGSINGYSTVFFDHDSKTICTKKFSTAIPKLKCVHCDLELSSNMNRHYERVHPDEVYVKPARKSPSKEPTEPSEELIEAKNNMIDFLKDIPDDSTFDIEIEEYMKYGKTTMSRMAGLRGDCVHWKKKEVLLDPYVLGLWLGDGYSNGREYTCNDPKDPEIIKYLEEWGKTNDATLLKLKKKFTYRFVSIENPGKINCNPMRNLLKKYDLIDNKHIPMDYLINDKDTRLKVLAGLIDTDGSVSREGKRIVLTQGMMHKTLIENTIFLARSLGFICSCIIKKTSWRVDGELKKGEAYSLNISGDIGCIPTLLPRKKCTTDRTVSIKSTGQIKIVEVEDAEYVGFSIDKNQRFVINDWTVTHNCANIYSTHFDIEISDTSRGKKYYQRFKNNMFERELPIITDIKKTVDSYTKITFLPDYKRFGLTNLTKDMLSLLKRRVYDIAGTVKTGTRVYYNGDHVNIKSFEDYIRMYYPSDDDDRKLKLCYKEFNERWSIGVVYDNTCGHRHMTFVNKISTFEGGTHLRYITDQIVSKITAYIVSKHKDLKIKPSQIKENITIFINSTIDDPSFSSQSKESLTTKISNFVVKCELTDDFILKIAKTGLIDEIVQMVGAKELLEMARSDGKKTTSMVKINKLDDARFAGTRRSAECRLILTEGDSAKTFAVSGLSIIGRDKYGVFPLKGKLLNVREATATQLLKNEEIKNLKQILGLRHNMNYSDVSKLRYGGIIILTDQDADGSHIKGLLMNFIHYFWPSLLKIDGFIQSLNTPIVKVYENKDIKKKSPIIFYTLSEFDAWYEINKDKSYTKPKYFKGLGTSTTQEAKESFEDFDKKIITYAWTKEDVTDVADVTDVVKKDKKDKSEKLDVESVVTEESEEILDDSYKAITLAFSKSKADCRKEWLKTYDKDNVINLISRTITYEDFVNKDLIHFSQADIIRSIPNIVDGLKPSQRKILYAAFKKKLEKTEIKVAQFSGYVSEHTGYHHGEASLQGAIIKMAQNFCGSNNLNMLKPIGVFGTRLSGGEDAASSRYIFTQLTTIARAIYMVKDEAILKLLEEDGDTVEPEVFYPIIPMILVNGSSGIGTGYSTLIPPHNPLDIIKNIRDYLNKKDVSQLDVLKPWYQGFTGTVEPVENKKSTNIEKYIITGKYKIINEFTIKITELPIGCWTQDYLKFLLKLCEEEEPIIYRYFNNCETDTIDIDIEFNNGELQKLIKANNIVKKLKLSTSTTLTNMHMYNNNVIVKYKNANEILVNYAKIRQDAFERRRQNVIQMLTNEMRVLKYRKQFIENILDKIIIIERRKKKEIIDTLIELEYPELSINLNTKPTFDYLTGMPLFSLTSDKIDEINKEYEEKKSELDIYSSITADQLWIQELDEFEVKYTKWLTEIDEDGDKCTKKPKGKKAVAKKPATKKPVAK